ncbi:MAG: hypothetical protein MUE93_07320 [Ignavibacteriaceae bacterium]|nr:hypothetical protein [Ignavibacteriaceae bacterium]
MHTEEENNTESDLSLKKAKPDTSWDVFKRWIPSIIILLLSAYWVVNRGEFGLLDNIDLVIHEAGHFFFMLFGKFIYTLGGTLMQIILPSIIAGYFLRNNYRILFSVGIKFITIGTIS